MFRGFLDLVVGGIWCDRFWLEGFQLVLQFWQWRFQGKLGFCCDYLGGIILYFILYFVFELSREFFVAGYILREYLFKSKIICFFQKVKINNYKV